MTDQALALYDAQRIRRDMAAKGWIAKDLADASGVSEMAVSRFLRGIAQSPRVAKKLAAALGRTPGDYMPPVSADAEVTR